jgi:PAS domain S-box-containing protein
MNMHRLLENQIKTYLAPEWLNDKRFLTFITAVNDSYTDYDRYITDKKNTEELLRRNEEKYRGIISNMNFGLIEVDLEDRIMFVNQSFCEMSGFKQHELYGRHAAALFMSKEDQLLIAEKNATRLEGIADAYEMQVHNRMGERRWWLISGAPRYNDLGKVVGSIGIHLDITEQKILENDLIEARQHAEELSRSKEAFLANMSHEIRTPMNAILGMGRQLRKTKLDYKQVLYLDTINLAAENLLVVINDILDISKIEAGKLVIEYIGFRMDDLLTRATRVMIHKAEEKGLRLTFSLDKNIHPVLLGDPYRLNQIMLNLISNAIKFTEKGSVHIACSLADRKGKQDILSVKVTDTGIGMEPAFLENIFRKFYQEDGTVARKYGGTGLGMSICRQLTQLMNGAIEVKSEKGMGTEITLTIPFARGVEADLPMKEEVVPGTIKLNGKKILLVEDNEMNRMVATVILNNYGAIVYKVVNGVEAVEAIRENQYDLVLMDMQMPVMGGLEATRIIRETIDTSTPIIALTANAIKGENDKCLAAGMNDYLSKPFEENELIRMITNWLDKEPLPNAFPVKPLGEPPLYTLSKLEKIGQGDQAFVQKMLHLFLQEVPAAIGAINMAYKSQDFATVHHCAHRIKPILGNLGVVSLKDDILEIEKTALEHQSTIRLEQLIHKLDTTVTCVAANIRCYLEEHAGSTIQ